jgi:hypothetical protein
MYFDRIREVIFGPVVARSTRTSIPNARMQQFLLTARTISSPLHGGFLAAVVIGLLAVAPADAWTRITTEDQFREAVIGRSITGHLYQVTAAADGSLTGVIEGLNLIGQWHWDDEGYYCTNALIAQHITGAYCSVVEIDGDQFRVTREKGNGAQFVYTLE